MGIPCNRESKLGSETKKVCAGRPSQRKPERRDNLFSINILVKKMSEEEDEVIKLKENVVTRTNEQRLSRNVLRLDLLIFRRV